uniref:uncharacterized protein LOC120326651 isoform X2 n=1 Tax=Styela clava TaxID=7725 RepID=UPI00193AA994|nr:uncharacterized protein LOC120326651 isoform X2 [Styela clava]
MSRETSIGKRTESPHEEIVKGDFDGISTSKCAENQRENMRRNKGNNKDNEDLEEVFRVLIRLIPDKSEWKAFVEDGLKMPMWEESETKEKKMEDLRRWKRVRGMGATPDNLCLIIREHFKNESSVVQALTDGLNKLSDKMNNLSICAHDKTTNLQSVEGRTVIVGAGNVQYH